MQNCPNSSNLVFHWSLFHTSEDEVVGRIKVLQSARGLLETIKSYLLSYYMFEADEVFDLFFCVLPHNLCGHFHQDVKKISYISKTDINFAVLLLTCQQLCFFCF